MTDFMRPSLCGVFWSLWQVHDLRGQRALSLFFSLISLINIGATRKCIVLFLFEIFIVCLTYSRLPRRVCPKFPMGSTKTLMWDCKHFVTQAKNLLVHTVKSALVWISDENDAIWGGRVFCLIKQMIICQISTFYTGKHEWGRLWLVVITWNYNPATPPRMYP